jgi:propionate CoA-transferase
MPIDSHTLFKQSGNISKNKVLTAQQAVELIHDGETIATEGFVGVGFAEQIAIALEDRFINSGSPKDLTLVYAAGQGDGKDKGLNHLAHVGLLKTVIGGHWGLVPKLQTMAHNNEIEAYNLPQGCISHLFRDIAAGKPGFMSKIGLSTFVDPRLGGGRVSECCKQDLVDLLTLNGEEYLFYKTFPINVAILRGTTADPDGNITMEKEALILESLSLATAAHNSGGLVIVQVERIAARGTLCSRDVVIPSLLVDAIVVSEPENHWQTFGERYNPAYSGELKVPTEKIPAMPLNARKIIARRAALELKANSVINLGIGMPEGIAQVANEEKIIDFLTLTTEPGVIGGIPMNGLNFGAAINAQAIISQPNQFDFYDGGGLDTAFLGLAQMDSHGNVNVSKFGPKLAGAGGFINISQSAKKVVFMGTFCLSEEQVNITGGQLDVGSQVSKPKFILDVEHITFSGTQAVKQNKEILYITERCVFQLTPAGLELIEIAPGINLARDILPHMEFQPIISKNLDVMDPSIFIDEPMSLDKVIHDIPLAQRIHYSKPKDTLFINFEGWRINDHNDLLAFENTVTEKLSAVEGKVAAIVNYDHFYIPPTLIEDYFETINRLGRFYSKVTRYSTSAFMKSKLGEALKSRGLAPHIHEGADI